jgi:hypothetical protein
MEPASFKVSRPPFGTGQTLKFFTGTSFYSYIHMTNRAAVEIKQKISIKIS